MSNPQSPPDTGGNPDQKGADSNFQQDSNDKSPHGDSNLSQMPLPRNVLFIHGGPSSPVVVANIGEPSPMCGSKYAEELMRVEGKIFDFTEKTIRMGFIRKVYCILMVQLLVTLGIMMFFMYHRQAKLFMIEYHGELKLTACIMTFACLIAIFCFENTRRKAPMNYIFLFTFTICEGFLLATTTLRLSPESFALAVGLTAVICFSLTCFAFQTKYDFTGYGVYLFIAMIVLLLFGVLLIFVFPGQTGRLIFSSLGALLFSFYLIYDTQRMIGGKHKYSISPEEYIVAALNLYIDVINIFLSLLGFTRR